ncbi:hypothetical protein WJ21_24085 [Burkholderia vietnamiensis]|nr:hypothetical protein WJ21_24085 [Burkholderia vietnamiensis]
METRQENAAYAALIPKFPHIKRMIDRGWIVMDGRYAILTAAGQAEMKRRGMSVTSMDESREAKPCKQTPVRSKAWKEGFDAAYKKLPPHPPYPLDSKEAADWGDGYVAGQD